MATPDALEALFETLYSHLNGADSLWSNRVQPGETIAAGVARPYVAFFHAGGGNDQSVPTRTNRRFTISVKVVADTLALSLRGQKALSDLLKDSGTQDVNPQLPAHANWTITTVTEDRVIRLTERFEGAQPIYHDGYQYDITMEAKDA